MAKKAVVSASGPWPSAAAGSRPRPIPRKIPMKLRSLIAVAAFAGVGRAAAALQVPAHVLS